MNILNTYKKTLLLLHRFPKFGFHRINKLKKAFPDLEKTLHAGHDRLLKAGIEEKIVDEFLDFRKGLEPDAILKSLEREKIDVVFFEDKNYPILLKEISDPPPLLYYKGMLDEPDPISLAVVGSRKNTPYGAEVARKILPELAASDFTVVSGLALGIDAIAHSTILDCGGRTVAIIGSGLDERSIYPSANFRLSERIIENGGAVISEFPPGTPPLRQHFPQRNRLIAGYTHGTLVIEANERSGSLITANLALDYGREVFAVPGNIFSPFSSGTHELIKRGAHPVTSARDITDCFGIIPSRAVSVPKKITASDAFEEKILDNLYHDPRHINELIRTLGLDTAKIMSTLTIMELKGSVRNVGGMEYIRL